MDTLLSHIKSFLYRDVNVSFALHTLISQQGYVNRVTCMSVANFCVWFKKPNHDSTAAILRLSWL
jgi:hypothetical protein